MSLMRSRMERLREKLDALRTRDRGDYDRGDHGYAEAPALTEAELTAVEQEYEVVFPDELRDFWLHVHGGGAGPHYGLLDPRDGEALPVSSTPSAECPLTATHAREESVPLGYATDADGDLLGVWPLADVGCGITELLVVTGPQRGFVWTAGDGILYPARNAHGTQRTFFDWYEAWLDEGLARCPPIADDPNAQRSVYVLELHNEFVGTLHASAEPGDLRAAVERFCAESQKYAFLPPKPDQRLGVWVIERCAVKQFIDFRPHLALVKGERQARLDRPDEVAALLEGTRGMPAIGAFHAIALWDAIEQQLPKLEGTALSPGEWLSLTTPISRNSSLPRRVGHGAWPWDAPVSAAPAPEAAAQRPSLAGRVARFLGLH